MSNEKQRTQKQNSLFLSSLFSGSGNSFLFLRNVCLGALPAAKREGMRLDCEPCSPSGVCA